MTTTAFPSMDIQAQLQLFKMMQEAVVQINKLGIRCSMFHDEIFVEAKNEQEFDAAMKVFQNLYDKDKAGN